MDRSAIRETGSSDTNRPAPAGEFDGYTRRQAMRDLLAKHEEPDPTRDVPAHRFWARQALRVMRLAVIVLALNICWGTRHADACTITANAKGEVTKSADCATKRLSPSAAADIIRPNQYVAPPVCTDCDGPRVAVAPYSGERWQQDFLRSAEFEARMKYLKNLGSIMPDGIPLVPYGQSIIVVPAAPHRRK